MSATRELSAAVHAARPNRGQSSLAFPVPGERGNAQPKGVASDSLSHGSVSNRESLPQARHLSPVDDQDEYSAIASINSKLRELAALDMNGCDHERAGALLGIPRRHVSFYTAPTSDKNFPLALVVPWVKAFGGCKPVEWALEQVGLWVGTPRDRILRDYGEACLNEFAARSRREQIEQRLECA